MAVTATASRTELANKKFMFDVFGTGQEVNSLLVTDLEGDAEPYKGIGYGI